MISIIVTIYNSQLYLDRCIKSIVHQSYSDIELILVDDGSTDNSFKICENWAVKDKRIKSISINNSGVGYSRNIGIAKSKGEYIVFVDSHDCLSRDCLKRLNEEIESNNVDIVCCRNLYIENITKKIIKSSKTLNIKNYKQIYNGREYVMMILENKVNSFIWNKIYKRKLLIDNKFDIESPCQDLLFLLDINNMETEIMFINDTLYYHTMCENILVENYHKKEYLTMIKTLFSNENLIINKFNSELTYSIRTAQLRYISYYLCRMPYNEYENNDIDYLYVYEKLVEINKYITNNSNRLMIKCFLYVYLKSPWLAKVILNFIEDNKKNDR